MKFVVTKAPSEAFALKNKVAVNPRDFNEKVKHVLINGQYAVSVERTDQVPQGQIGCSTLQRTWAHLSINDEVDVSFFEPSTEGTQTMISKMSIELDLVKKNKIDPVDAAELNPVFAKAFEGTIFSAGASVAFDYRGTTFKGTVLSIDNYDPSAMGGKKGEKKTNAPRGVLLTASSIVFSKAMGATFEITGSSAGPVIVDPDFKFEDLGIGGLDSEFKSIFRRAFASRIFPPNLVASLGIKHVKGILLYGPPGTGKTLMARQIGKMLRAREPKIVNGPEILSKFVGQSEENIRNLFADAEAEYKQKGDSSALHIIIFDELDAICKQRGSRNDGTGVGDSVVNQILSKMDGVNQLNNILIIGMTNRKDMIDEAILRSGRMEVHIEVSLPDKQGRLAILKIHTAKMEKNGKMEKDVSLEELSDRTKNFTGAEIEGLIKSATSYALNRHIEGGTMAKVKDDAESVKVTKGDFDWALQEVIPAFGVASDEFQGTMLNGIIDYGPSVENVVNAGQLYINQVKQSERTPLISLLLHGPTGAGTTSLAVKLAQNSEFPYIKLISPEKLVGRNETAKASEIARIFENSYKSPLSVVVVDCIEKLLEYVPIGPRFSNTVLQTLIVFLKRLPPPGHKLFIISTTSKRTTLEEMGMTDCFDGELYVPNIQSTDEISHVVNALNLFSSKDQLEKCVQILKSMNADNSLSIGVKKLLMYIEMARQVKGNELERIISLLKDSMGK